MREFTNRFRVRASLDDVAAFHKDTRALRWLTPPPVYVQFHKVDPVGENSRSEFTMWIGPVPVRWVALHTEYDSGTGFVDSQVIGPFKCWEHRHSFISVDEQTTEIVDTIRAELGDRPLSKIISGFMWMNLSVLFAYRAWMTRYKLDNKVVGEG